MRLRFLFKRAESGSVLMITLVIAILLGTTLASYLYWVRTQNVLVSESQAWNSALAVAEAGVEEAMAQLNVNVGTLNPLDYLSSIQSAQNGWSGSGSGPFTKSGALGYTVIVSNDTPPTIYSTGTNLVPMVNSPIRRTVMVKTATNGLFGVAIAAIQNIKMNGNYVYVDAYDSSDRVHFTNGLYNLTYALAKGDVATTGGLLDVGNADIHGRIIVSPTATGYSVNVPNGLVGDMSWAGPGVQSPTTDWVITDFNKEFPDVGVPYNTGFSVPYWSTTNTFLLSGQSYIVNGDLTLNNKDILYVTGASTLYVTGSVKGQNGSTISVGPGATLKLYVGTTASSGSSITLDSVNNAGNAANFQIYGLPSCTAFTLNGNGAYIGTVYAPEAQLKFNGGGANTLDFQGACVVYSADIDGHFNIHYDVNLSRSGPPSGYTLSSWQEL